MYNLVIKSGRKWEMKFFGTYYHNLDAKGRLVVPAVFRDELKELKTLYLLQGFDGAISLYPEDAYRKELAYLESLDFKGANARAYSRLIYSSIEKLEVDNTGRVMLSVRILKKYALTSSVTVIGVGDHLEVWDSQKYADYENSAHGKLEDLAEGLSSGHHE